MIITLDNVKDYNNINTSCSETVLNMCISASIDYAQEYCQRDLISGSYIDYTIGKNNDVYYPDNIYIQSVTSIESSDGDGTYTDIFNISPDTISNSTRIDNRNNSINILKGYCLTNGVEHKVTYESGYDTSSIPGDLFMVLLEITTHFYNMSPVSGESRLGLKGSNISSGVSEGSTYMSLSEMQETWKLILNNYKREII